MEQMKLFEDAELYKLPVELMDYHPYFFSRAESDAYYQILMNTVPWEQREMKMYDKMVIRPRLSAWYGKGKEESESVALEWTPELLAIKSCVEAKTGVQFSSVLLNYYRDGNDSVAWHSDKDTVPGLKTEIASVSFGQVRAFDFRHKNNHQIKHSLELGHGSLLLMKGDLQRYWEHRIAKSAMPMTGRINLTFRIVV
ncbi:MAG: alpha-ketoglutarate-dependent dioxygenase AlkB [Bacteroidetes bacterium 43-16]|nr:MAG: alpha-ketoglutarate-dependent dioxygenase AlkB [Bacteroidetes bacterium 43-16]